jgi:hypothetical protein
MSKHINLDRKYLAFVLDGESQQRLLSRCPTFHPRIIAHHVTLEYDNISKIGLEMVGTTPKVWVIGSAHNRKAQAVIVSVNGAIDRADHKYFHVTVSLAESAKEVDSNDAIFEMRKLGIPMLWQNERLPLTGTVQLLDKSS